MNLTVEASSAKSFDVLIETKTDPTGGSVSFGLSTASGTVPSSYSAGTWDTDNGWSQTSTLPPRGRVYAETPTIGLSGTATLAITEGSTYYLWAKVGDVIEKVASIRAT